MNDPIKGRIQRMLRMVAALKRDPIDHSWIPKLSVSAMP
jgi:hypothetical protein